MSETLNEKRRAERAWCAAGRTRNALKTMSEEEISLLAELVDERGTPIAGFKEQFAEFLEEYLDSRKASEAT